MASTDTFSTVLTESSLEGAEVAKVLSIALFGLIIYEYLITLDDEIEYFWRASLSPAGFLFLFNRYMPACIALLIVIAFSLPNPSDAVCQSSTQLTLLLTVAAISVIQGILITKIWYLFSANRSIKIILITAFIVSLGTTLAFLYMSTNEIQVIKVNYFPHLTGCRVSRPPSFWRIYIPSLILHTGLYALTAYWALTSRKCRDRHPLIKRLLQDGGCFYFIVFFSVGFTSIGSFLVDNPYINVPAIYSPIVLSTSSIAVNRLLLGIRSLSEDLGDEIQWLTNEVGTTTEIDSQHLESGVDWVNDNRHSISIYSMESARHSDDTPEVWDHRPVATWV
ncbi:hypothetical protein BDQ12DRAFT_625122 [Crucibulum laeve]|uniref:DUF6533 domain-containing protein n=1 Tax=Crucibulum laeve TaxID=68775 RepID=A0A5C3ME75_9AGAR|nr:hypothetical protein BDQ12DRAFT_625122 [Crucibulum laeve]